MHPKGVQAPVDRNGTCYFIPPAAGFHDFVRGSYPNNAWWDESADRAAETDLWEPPPPRLAPPFTFLQAQYSALTSIPRMFVQLPNRLDHEN